MQEMDTAAVEGIIGYVFTDKSLLSQAFTHRSYINEHRGENCSQNERLEFLGDSVLSLIVSAHLYKIMPNVEEGELSSMRAHLVDGHRCAIYLQQLKVGQYLFLGKGEQMNLGKGREGILADLFEALLGAIYLDGGFSVARDFFFRNFAGEVETALDEPHHNWKAELQDFTQKNFGEQPKYEVEKEEGPDHEKFFHVAVFYKGEKQGMGFGCSKKEAAQNAAHDALNKVNS
jgi:ribonuclease III